MFVPVQHMPECRKNCLERGTSSIIEQLPLHMLMRSCLRFQYQARVRQYRVVGIGFFMMDLSPYK